MSTVLLSCKDLVLGYEGMHIIEGLSFDVSVGDYLCIVGENGSGKSTLLKNLLHLKTPLGGTITLCDGLRRTDIGYLPQQTVVQKDFPASVWEIVLSGCLNRRGLRPFYNKAEKTLAADAMEKMGVTPLMHRCFRDLSGGQQQRVLLARALCAAKRLLLLDEPVSGLDPMVTQEMYALISRLNREDGLTVVMVSHDIPAAARYASHILHIDRAPQFFGTTADYLQTDVGRRFANPEGGAAE